MEFLGPLPSYLCRVRVSHLQEAHLPQRYRTMHDMAVQGHSRSSVVVLIDMTYMTSYYRSTQ